MFSDRRRFFPFLVFLTVPVALPAQSTVRGGCSEVPREDALPSVCAPPTSETMAPAVPDSVILLKVPAGTALRVAVDEKVRIAAVGQVVSGKITETVYAFDQAVIPAGSEVTGKVTSIHAVPGMRKAMSYANGNFSPYHEYELEFDSVTLPDKERRAIVTTVSPGIAQVVHLVPGGMKKKPNAAQRQIENAKTEAKAKVNDTLDEIKAPGKMHRLKEMVLAQSPYRRQYLQPGTRFYASLTEPLDFGKTSRTAEQLAQLGRSPEPDSILHARFAEEVSSATAQRGNVIAAVLTEPLFSQDHHLLLPANSRIAGEVIKAKPARKLHHNGEADRRSGVRLDDEGGAQATDSKTRYLSTGVAVLLAAAASHTDNEHGTTDAAGDPGVRAGAGVSGSGITGTLISLAARSQPVSMAFAAYGAGNSVYNNFLSRGKDVVFIKNTPLEIGFSEPHAKGAAKKP
jgi:hypothetical protein